MSWIHVIPYEKADALLKKIYDRIKGPDDNIDNILMAHSLRPHTLTGHITLYKNVLHHTGNTLPQWYLETIGTYVSTLNHCTYCIDHHFAGLRRILQDDSRAKLIKKAIAEDDMDAVLDKKFAATIPYIKKLTLHPSSMAHKDIEALKVFFNDGEVLEINQVVSYFCYANRTVLGLGVTTDGDILGLSPGKHDDPGNWTHQ